jgi:vacuolar-type H+-ATPase subunit I/STV1
LKIADEGSEGGEKKDDSKKADDASGMDEVKKMIADLGEKVAAMSKPKDEEKKDDGKKDDKKADDADEDGEKKDAKDDGEEGEGDLEGRLKALETAVAKILSILEDAGSEEGEESEDEDAEESEDEDSEESEDEGSVVGDDASRIEILAPGSRFKGKDARKKALETAYASDDGKRVITALTGGKKPTFDAKTVDTLFVATAEVLKSSRNELAGTKKAKANDSGEQASKGPMTPEKMNEMNAKRYNLNK